MQTAGLVQITPTDKSVRGIVNYNLRTKKTTGRWPHDPSDYQQRDLVSFHGLGGLARTVPSGAHSFLLSTYNGIRTHGLLVRRYQVSHCRTIVQSFDYQANPHLKPRTAHAMANTLYERIERYLRKRYGYCLDAGMVSTHIDDDKVKPNPNPASSEKVVYPHLHSHIVLPAYNSTGRPIYPYLRKADVYQFQQIDDDIVTKFGLEDYYFQKARRLVHPMSAYTLNGKHRKTASNLEKAQQAFTEADRRALPASRVFHLTPNNFKQVRRKRDGYLRIKFDFRTKKTRDTQTGRQETKFTLNTFSHDELLQTPWYALNNLRILRWRDYKEARAEGLFRCFDFTGVQAKAVSFHDFRKTIQVSALYARERIKRNGQVRQISLLKIYAGVRKRGVKNSHKYDNLNPDEETKRFLERELAGASRTHGADRLVHNANTAVANSKRAEQRKTAVNGRPKIQHAQQARLKKRRYSHQRGIDIQ